MRELIEQKIQELKELAERANEPSVQIVMLALSGSMKAHREDLFATNVQMIVRSVMLPKAIEDKANNTIHSN